MEFLITMLTPFADLIKVIGIVGGGILTAYKLFKKFFTKELEDKLKDIYDGLTEIKDVNTEQSKNIEKMLNQQQVLINVDRDLIKANITTKYYSYQHQGFFPLYERECLTLVYQDYKALNGNSFIDSLYDELMELPSSL